MSQETANWTTESPLVIKNKLSVICILFTGITAPVPSVVENSGISDSFKRS